MTIKISSDSTCDLSPELIERYQVSLSPLTIIKEGKPYLDGVEIIPDDIFRHVDGGGALCSTAAVNVEAYRKQFAELATQYDAVIHLTLGSLFSACYQNATIAAADFPNVYVVDSQNLSTGQGLLVVEAAELAASGMSAMEICSTLNALRQRVHASFILDRLDYMQKGGRCSAVTALGGRLLRIKPCIAVQDGAMKMVGKYRGRFASAVDKYVTDFLKDRKDLRLERVFITHTPVEDDAVQAARDAIAKIADFAEVFETSAGCTVSCHCGPGTLGVLFMTK